MIIGVSGKIGSGKDTVGKIIQYLVDKSYAGFKNPNSLDDYNSYCRNEHWRKGHYEIKKFAGKLKECVSIVTGIPVADLEKEDVKNSSLGENWIRYSYATGFTKDNDGKVTMLSTQCDKGRYILEAKVNYQTAYKTEYTVRMLLQHFGTEVGRLIHRNFWVNALFADYNPKGFYHNIDDSTNDYDVYPNWIITDVRFPNEAEAIKERGGFIIRINRDSPCEVCSLTISEKRGNACREVACPRGRSDYKGNHPSETSLDDYNFDYVIDNNGTIEELIEKVKEVLIKEKII